MKNIYETKYLKDKREEKEREMLLIACRKYINKITNIDDKGHLTTATDDQKVQDDSVITMNQNKTDFKTLLSDMAKEIVWLTKYGKKVLKKQQIVDDTIGTEHRMKKNKGAGTQITRKSDVNQGKHKAMKHTNKRKKTRIKQKAKHVTKGDKEAKEVNKGNTIVENDAVTSDTDNARPNSAVYTAPEILKGAKYAPSRNNENDDDDDDDNNVSTTSKANNKKINNDDEDTSNNDNNNDDDDDDDSNNSKEEEEDEEKDDEDDNDVDDDGDDA